MFDFVSAKVNLAPTLLASFIRYMATAGFVIPLFAVLWCVNDLLFVPLPQDLILFRLGSPFFLA
jgi:hypothetical protein